MTREQFTEFVAQALEDVIALAEEQSGKQISRSIAFQWLGANKPAPIRDGIVETIVNRVYVDDDAIYPCVDIGVGDLLDDGTPLIIASVAGYPPEPFGKNNWTGRDGPFVRIVGAAFMAKVRGGAYREVKGAHGFLIPDMKDLT